MKLIKNMKKLKQEEVEFINQKEKNNSDLIYNKICAELNIKFENESIQIRKDYEVQLNLNKLSIEEMQKKYLNSLQSCCNPYILQINKMTSIINNFDNSKNIYFNINNKE